jgi:CheY-like chemotaxis protein
MDGYALAERIRADLGADAPRVIALTGYGLDQDHGSSRRAGFEAHFVKPVDTQRLLEAIAACRPTGGQPRVG